jgi:SAM-dependent methyltransferase
LSQDSCPEKWNKRHQQAESGGTAAQVLLRNLHLLPNQGRALDMACGRGASALLLAEQGLETHAWDFSAVAVERLLHVAEKRNLCVHAEVRDVVAQPPEANRFDVILVSFFLERALFPVLFQALRPGGKLYYQTFVRDVFLDRGPTTPEWRLEKNELLTAFNKLDIRYYREDGLDAGVQTELSDLALMVASKRN